MNPDLSVIVSHFTGCDVATDQIQPVCGGFSGAGVWSVDVAGNKFALRRWPRNGLPTARILGLHNLLEHVTSEGVDTVSVPLKDRRGKTLADFYSHPWQVEPWMPGTADFHANPSDSRLSNAMRTLAAWHSAAASYPATDCDWFLQRTGPSPAVGERLKRIDWLTTNGSIDQLRQQAASDKDPDFRETAMPIVFAANIALPVIRTELSSLLHTGFRLQPCLRDIWHDHVLFVDDEVTGLIDPSACRSENIATDLARLLGSLVADDAPRWEFALSAYSDSCSRGLSESERQLVRVLDRSSVLLSPLTWLTRRYLDHDTFHEPQAVLNRLRQQRDRLLQLTQ